MSRIIFINALKELLEGVSCIDKPGALFAGASALFSKYLWNERICFYYLIFLTFGCSDILCAAYHSFQYKHQFFIVKHIPISNINIVTRTAII